MKNRLCGKLSTLGCASLAALMVVPFSVQAAGGSVDENGERTSRISDDSVPQLDIENFPKRPKPILELGNHFLGTGNIKKGIEMPGGAIWQPSLLVFGTYRTALQSFNGGQETTTEWANRLDLFANLQLTGSERFLLGIRPLDQDGKFTSYQFEPDSPGNERGWESETNAEVTTFFFEGDLGELFPNWDRSDRKSTDIGFSVGRQPINYQAGLLINDSIDAIGVTRNTLVVEGGSDLQATFLFGWNDIHRNNNTKYSNQKLYALTLAADMPKTTINANFVYIQDRDGDTDGFFWGVSDVRRIGHYNLSSRILGSHALDTESAVVSDGNLLFTQLSWTPPWTDDNVYVNAFAGIDNFSSAARAPSAGGPLGQAGILFQAIGMGRYGAPLGNRADHSLGGALGYQWFLSPIKNQFIFEVGARTSTHSDVDEAALAAGVRYRHVFGQHVVWQVDGFAALNESDDNSYGARMEMQVQF